MKTELNSRQSGIEPIDMSAATIESEAVEASQGLVA
jgi:hypothetical protein